MELETLTYPQALALAEKVVAMRGGGYKNRSDSMISFRDPCIVGMMMRQKRGNYTIMKEHEIQNTGGILTHLYQMDERTTHFLSELIEYNDQHLEWGEVLSLAEDSTDVNYGPMQELKKALHVLAA